MTRRQFLALILPLLLVLLGYVGISLVERSGAVGTLPWDEEFVRHVRSTMAYEYVGGVQDERLAWEAYFRALNQYVQTFDAHAEIVAPWDVARRREDSSGQYVGIGIRTDPGFSADPEAGIRVTGVKPGGPADAAGVVVGDTIVAVDGAPVQEISPQGDFDRIATRIKGREGTKVRLRLRDTRDALRDVVVTRAQIESGSVFGARIVDPEAGVGYVRIAGFVLDTARSFRDQLGRLLEQGIGGLVLDLRENAGGILPQAVEVADTLLSSGVIVRVRGRGEEFNETYVATPATTMGESLAVAVLVNNRSASASEVLACALRDHRRAVLVGQRTWGKFLVQTVEELPMELGTVFFKRTSAIYESPFGNSYPRATRGYDPLAGLEPDLYVPASEEDHATLLAIFENEAYADWNPARGPVHSGFRDHVLEAAVALLRGETYYPRLASRDAAEE